MTPNLCSLLNHMHQWTICTNTGNRWYFWMFLALSAFKLYLLSRIYRKHDVGSRFKRWDCNYISCGTGRSGAFSVCFDGGFHATFTVPLTNICCFLFFTSSWRTQAGIPTLHVTPWRRTLFGCLNVALYKAMMLYKLSIPHWWKSSFRVSNGAINVEWRGEKLSFF